MVSKKTLGQGELEVSVANRRDVWLLNEMNSVLLWTWTFQKTENRWLLEDTPWRRTSNFVLIAPNRISSVLLGAF